MGTHAESSRRAVDQGHGRDEARGARVAVCSVATVNHLHLVLNLARTIRATWSSHPRIVVALADGSDAPRPGFARLDVDFVDATDLAIEGYAWLAAKYDATELCCAIKPFVVRHLLDQGHAQVVYCDADLHFFSEPTELLAAGTHHDFVVTPHTLEPPPADEPWQRPTLGDLSGAGLMNAGLFSVQASDATRGFLARWSDLVVAPGAFLRDLGGQHEQNSFSWVVAFAEDVAICRDRTINVAYWNLHERPVRWSALDGGPEDEWTVDGERLGCFHFSGFAWSDGRLSTHDGRHLPSLDVNLHALCRFYAARLQEAEPDHYALIPYGFAEIDGHLLTIEVRDALKRAERLLAPRVDSFLDDVPTLLRRLNDPTGSSMIVPQYLEQILVARPDLRVLNGDDVLFPERLLSWASGWFDREYAYGYLFEHYCDFAWDRAAVERVADELVRLDPELDAETARQLALRDRRRALDLLEGRAELGAVAELVHGASYRFAAHEPALCLRLIHFSRSDLREAFPDPLGENLSAFRAWLERSLEREYAVPDAVARLAADLDPARSLARVVAFARGSSALNEHLKAHGIDGALLRSLLPAAASDAGFGPTDLVLVDWWLRGAGLARATRATERRSTGTPTLPARVRGLVARARRRSTGSLNAAPIAAPAPAAAPAAEPSRNGDEPATAAPLGDPVRATLHDRLAVREPGDPRFATYLDAWLELRDGLAPVTRRRGRLVAAAAELVAAASGSSREGFVARWTAAIARTRDRHVRLDLERLYTPDLRGVNVFGYFKSPIGLGTATRGLCRALEIAGYRHRDVVLVNMTMATDLTLADLIPDFAFHFPTNLVVSYPHIQCDAFEVFPASFFAGRENIGYLAWEQRDLHPDWAERLRRFDRLFALSSFAADSLERGVGRSVGVLPCVVEVDAERAARHSRADFGIPEQAFAVGFVFDASSSVERKNPMGAVRAIARAFAGRGDVVVVMKITNGDRYPFTRNVERIVQALRAAGLPSVVLPQVMSRERVEALIASLDLYVSLHRAEGFGYTLAEAMLLGVPALATRYSGNLDFMNDDNSWLVECRETIVRRAEGPFRLGTVWADPDLDDAAEKCRRVYDDRAETRRRAERARRDVAATLSPEAIAQRLDQMLSGARPASRSAQDAPEDRAARAATAPPETP